MENYSAASLVKVSIRALRTVFLSIIGGVVAGILAALVGSFFHVER